MNRVRVFVPGHLTGFFEICNGASYLTTGSKGAGLSIDIGVLTEIIVEKNDSNQIQVFFNDKQESNPVTTKYVVNTYLESIKNESYTIRINHYMDFPIGCGFGASGAGALGAALGLNLLLNQHLTRNQCAQIAHAAEVSNKTGLGDVIAQTFGGVEIRVLPGAPGYGVLDNIIYPVGLQVVCFTIGKIDTSSIIGDPEKKSRINKAGSELVKKLLEAPSISNLMRYSYQFANDAQLIPETIHDILKNLHSEGYKDSSMIMLGNSLFCIVDGSETGRVRNIIENNTSKGHLYITNIDNQGARVIA